MPWGEVYEQFASAYGYTIDEINKITLCQAILFMHYRSKRISGWFETIGNIISSLFGFGDSSEATGSAHRPSHGEMQDLDAIVLPTEVMQKAAEKIKGIKEGEWIKDGIMARKIVRKKKDGRSPDKTDADSSS